jgi:hypothetical protein
MPQADYVTDWGNRNQAKKASTKVGSSSSGKGRSPLTVPGPESDVPPNHRGGRPVSQSLTLLVLGTIEEQLPVDLAQVLSATRLKAKNPRGTHPVATS